MDYPKFIVSNQKEESINIQRLKGFQETANYVNKCNWANKLNGGRKNDWANKITGMLENDCGHVSRCKLI